MFSRSMALSAFLLLVCFAGTASADRLVDFNHNHVDGATVAAKLWQKGGEDRGLYVEVSMRNTRRFPGCINGAVAWRRSGPSLIEFKTSAPRPRPLRVCTKKTWFNLGRTAVRNVGDFTGVQTHVGLEGGGKGKWDEIIGWSRTAVKRQADGLMNLSYRRFIKRKRVAMRNRNRAGARADKTWPLDWTDDGCSIPGQKLSGVASKWSRTFDGACQQHDFGYRNYGSRALRLNRNEGTRLRIDNKLHRESKRACRNGVRGGGINQRVKRRGCLASANIIRNSVRLGGWKPFFGQN